MVIASATQVAQTAQENPVILRLATIGTGICGKAHVVEILRIEQNRRFVRKHRSFALESELAMLPFLLLLLLPRADRTAYSSTSAPHTPSTTAGSRHAAPNGSRSPPSLTGVRCSPSRSYAPYEQSRANKASAVDSTRYAAAGKQRRLTTGRETSYNAVRRRDRDGCRHVE